MNQKVGIYIILSVILLYLYYKRNDLAIFAVFVAVVAGALKPWDLNGDREGFGRRSGSGSGGGGGGGSGSGDECETMGLTAPKIVKDEDGDLGESLEKEMKKINKVAKTYWPYDAKGSTTDETDKKNLEVFFAAYMKESKNMEFSDEENADVKIFIENMCQSMYNSLYDPDETKRKKITLKPSDIPKGFLGPYISAGKKVLELLKKARGSSHLKGKGPKKLGKYLVCLCKHWIAIFTMIDGMATGKSPGTNKNDGGGDDEEVTPKKKKKASLDDDGGGDAE